VSESGVGTDNSDLVHLDDTRRPVRLVILSEKGSRRGMKRVHVRARGIISDRGKQLRQNVGTPCSSWGS